MRPLRCITRLWLSRRCHSTMQQLSSEKKPELKLDVELDLEYLCSERSLPEIERNVKIRKGVGDIRRVRELHSRLVSDPSPSPELLREFEREAKKIPNRTHPAVRDIGDEPRLVELVNARPEFESERDFRPLDFADIAKKLNLMRTDKLGTVCGHKSYYFMDELARLEEALVRHTMSRLIRKGFAPVSVPDILPRSIIESCGMNLDGERKQIYSLDATHHNPELTLSGTAEMSLAGLLMHTRSKEKDLPLRLAAVSRCYRAETSNIIEQRGIYRVHQFTKVEMFGATTPDHSEEMLEEFRSIEEEIFSELGLHMRVLDMPPHELGAPAYRKYDIEAWMPGRKMFGEISSCSNCTDYQSRRLGIKYTSSDRSEEGFVHTLNGTACAVPRMIIALCETHQKSNGKISIPVPLQKYMGNNEYISRTAKVPFLKLSKLK